MSSFLNQRLLLFLSVYLSMFSTSLILSHFLLSFLCHLRFSRFYFCPSVYLSYIACVSLNHLYCLSVSYLSVYVFKSCNFLFLFSFWMPLCPLVCPFLDCLFSLNGVMHFAFFSLFYLCQLFLLFQFTYLSHIFIPIFAFSLTFSSLLNRVNGFSSSTLFSFILTTFRLITATSQWTCLHFFPPRWINLILFRGNHSPCWRDAFQCCLASSLLKLLFSCENIFIQRKGEWFLFVRIQCCFKSEKYLKIKLHFWNSSQSGCIRVPRKSIFNACHIRPHIIVQLWIESFYHCSMILSNKNWLIWSKVY